MGRRAGAEWQCLRRFAQPELVAFIRFQRDSQGFSEPATQHLTFNLRTGRPLTLAELVAELVADPPAQLERRLGLAISRRLHDERANLVASYGGDSTLIAHVAQLYGIEHWNTTPQAALRLDMGSCPAMARGESLFYLTECALRPDALLIHPVGMPRLGFEFLPDELHVFPYDRLQPRAIPLPLLEAERSRKKVGRKPE